MHNSHSGDPPQQPVEVAIIGGGCAAMAAAFELSDPKHAGKYHVTIYQQGWRLGGKGASGRGANARIEEHGLHLWMGFYENAFRIMRECYTELDRDPQTHPVASWRDAFKPDPFIAVSENNRSDHWKHWVAHFPPLDGQPGDPVSQGKPFTVSGYLRRCILLIRILLDSVDEKSTTTNNQNKRGSFNSAADILDWISRFSKIGQLATITALREACRVLEAAFRQPSLVPQQTVVQLLQNIHQALNAYSQQLTDADPAMQRLWEIVDIVLAAVRGCVRYGLITHPQGFDAINDYDWREWLRDNGAAERSLDSAFLRASYDLLFAYENGDINKPRLAAGQALRGAFRMFFSYRGAVFYKMQAGMGDIVFAPFYEVLRARGVTFNFFHRLRHLSVATPTPDNPDTYISALDFDIQAKTIKGREYQPLVDVHGLPCWPSQADYTQLQNGKKLAANQTDFESHWEHSKAATVTLTAGSDFDLAILAVGYGELPYVAAEIINHNPRWRTMLNHIKSVETQAFQIWLNKDLKELGWHKPSVNLSGFVEPFDTWADMTHLLPTENWQTPVKTIAYFCSVLADDDTSAPDNSYDHIEHNNYPHKRDAMVRQAAIDFLNNDIAQLWPQSVDISQSGEHTFKWHTLSTDTDPADDERAFDTQFHRANCSPTERYVLSLPGTLKYSISPLDNTYDNFSVAGDWTACGHQAGCVEAAVMSGLLAAHSICGSPRLENIVGYDHP